MRYIQAPEVYRPAEHRGYGPAVFLAGGITDCTHWQDTMVEALADVDAVILNPRQSNFPLHDPNAERKQVTWEFDHLDAAAIVSFWFDAGPSHQPIALYELGRHAGDPDKRIVVGCHPDYVRRNNVEIQLELARPGLAIHTSLDDLIAAVRAEIAQA
jgi:hypothetical protein